MNFRRPWAATKPGVADIERESGRGLLSLTVQVWLAGRDRYVTQVVSTGKVSPGISCAGGLWGKEPRWSSGNYAALLVVGPGSILLHLTLFLSAGLWILSCVLSVGQKPSE